MTYDEELKRKALDAVEAAEDACELLDDETGEVIDAFARIRAWINE